MSDSLRVALVAEGPTDAIVVEAALQSMLGRPVLLTLLQPEGSVAFGETGTGWGGVYRWCVKASVPGGGRLATNRLVLEAFDVLILHVDADVAGKLYGEATIAPRAGDKALPCERDCPPVETSTNALRGVLLSWCGEEVVPPKVVLCVPSKSTEAWVVASLFPADRAVTATSVPFECLHDPGARLGQQPVRKRLRKTQSDYRSKEAALQAAWSRIAGPCGMSEARRFQQDFLAAL